MHNLPDLSDLRLFTVVVHATSLARAAAELGLSPSTVSKRLSVLEDRLGVRVLHRTTRQIALTEDGETVYRWAQRLLSATNDMAQELSVAGGSPTGVLRVSTSSGFGRNHVALVLSGFAARHPEVEVRLDALDRPVDVLAEGIDIDVRVGGRTSRICLPAVSSKTGACFARLRPIWSGTAAQRRLRTWPIIGVL